MLAPRRDDGRGASKRSTNGLDVEEIKTLYPVGNFEATVFAELPRLRPSQEFTFQDFREMPSMNGTRGRCVDCDAAHLVWTLELDDLRRVRVVHPSLRRDLSSSSEKEKNVVKCVIA
jgi:hypothetical protein